MRLLLPILALFLLVGLPSCDSEPETAPPDAAGDVPFVDAGDGWVCEPDCTNRECGLDPVCGTSCGDCGEGTPCIDGQCTCPPPPDACGDRECGPMPDWPGYTCGELAGECPASEECTPDGMCIHVDYDEGCGDRECGPGPNMEGYFCGDLGGNCPEGELCNADGMCVAE